MVYAQKTAGTSLFTENQSRAKSVIMKLLLIIYEITVITIFPLFLISSRPIFSLQFSEVRALIISVDTMLENLFDKATRKDELH